MKTRNAAFLLGPLALAAWACAGVKAPAPQATVVTIYVTQRHQTIEGFGTCLVSWEPEMARWYERPETVRMFAQDMGLNILRCNLWGDGTIGPTANADSISYRDPAFAKSDPRTPVFLKFAQAVRKLNPDLKVIGTVWSPPAWMKANGKITDDGAGGIDGATYQQDKNGAKVECLNRVKPDRYPHFAKWLTEMVRYYEANGVPMYAVSAANEPQFTQGFESCVWTATDLAKISGMTGDALKKAGLGRVKLFGPETMTGFNWEGGPNRRYVQAFRDDPAAWSALGFYASHGYTDGVSPDVSSNSSAQFWSIVAKDDKPYWVTEGGTGGHAWPEPVRQKGVGIAIHNALVAGNASAFVPWQFAEGDPSEHALTVKDHLDKKGQVVRQYARFIPAGSVRVDATPGYGDLNVSAFTKGKDLTVVLLNPKASPKRVSLDLKGLSTLAALNVVRTSATEDGAVLPPLRVTAGRATVDVPGDAIVTLTTLAIPPRN
ncbi:hypothetical protein BH11ARM2_BH11ARM2_34280 [soil metagenome]